MKVSRIAVLGCLLLALMVSVALAANAMPQGFKGDLVLPPNSELIKQQDEPPYVEVVSSDDMKTVYEFYKKDLTAKGWKVSGDYPNLGNTYQIQFKKDGKTLTVGIGQMKNGKAIARIMLQ